MSASEGLLSSRLALSEVRQWLSLVKQQPQPC